MTLVLSKKKKIQIEKEKNLKNIFLLFWSDLKSQSSPRRDARPTI